MFRYYVLEGETAHEVLVEETGESLFLTFRGVRRKVEITQVAPTRYHVRLNGKSLEATVRWEGQTVIVEIGPERYEFQVRPLVPARARPRGEEAETRASPVVAPMPGLLVSVEVREGDRVNRGQPVAILEAMKMQMEIHAPTTGVVRAVHAQPGQEVKGGQVLVVIREL
ncbi:MAG: biotin/lipoyl-containing protein [Armatimonadota bacterium]|nr:biotin/lipoyl-containing protein [Armatimonadota bacterium]MDR5702951.1 biotin/lipoyl-containing protein [Armatimonadota bacterium]MDR7433858.1 biotin/lipoyl-containing protein [Armatimonadota bacterium]